LRRGAAAKRECADALREQRESGEERPHGEEDEQQAERTVGADDRDRVVLRRHGARLFLRLVRRAQSPPVSRGAYIINRSRKIAATRMGTMACPAPTSPRAQ